MNVDAVEHLSPFFVITEEADMILALFILLVIHLYGVYIQFKKHKLHIICVNWFRFAVLVIFNSPALVIAIQT